MAEREQEFLRPGERFDDLQRNGLRILQHPGRFCFGMDAVLLSGFACVRPGERVLDLGTGTGILPILLSAKTQGREFVGLEIQPESADMARRSVEYNGIGDRVRIVEGDLREASARFGNASFDVVTANPPYMEAGAGLSNPQSEKAIARHEICCTFRDVARETAKVLPPGGRFFLVHRPQRLVELIQTLSEYALEPKRMKFVQPYVCREPNMVLMECVKGAKRMVTVEAPIIVFEKPGVYHADIRDVYGY